MADQDRLNAVALAGDKVEQALVIAETEACCKLPARGAPPDQTARCPYCVHVILLRQVREYFDGERRRCAYKLSNAGERIPEEQDV